MHTATLDEVVGLCDKCGAMAKVRAELLSGELLFCGHHAREAGETLIFAAVRVYDPEDYMSMGRP